MVLNSRMELSRQVARLERKKSDRVIAPVVAQTALHKLAVVDESVHGHEFDRGHAQAGQIFDNGSGGQACIGSAQVRGNVGVAHGESFDVKLVDDGLVPGNSGRRIRSPGEGGVDHAILRHSGSVVAPVERQILLLVSDPVSKVRVAPADGSLNLLAVGIEQKFVVIKTMPLLGSVRAIHSISVQLAGTHFWQIAVPDHVGLLGKRNAKSFTSARNVEQAKFHFLRVLGVEREVDALAVPG